MRSAVLLLVLATLGCATTKRASRAAEFAPTPGRAGPLAELEKNLQDALGADRSGFKLLDVNEDALRWRLALIDSAQHSLDLMTFLWWGDEAGDLILMRVIAAADRGVKVRLIVDDMTTIDDGKKTTLRDVPNAAVNAHPNIELRVFNPWSNRGALGRAVEFVGDFTKLNQRMHNKALIADNHAAIMGGRNLGNEYMGLNPTFNFRDLDVLTVGHASRQISSVFDRYWNSDWVRPQAELDANGTLETLKVHREALLRQLQAATTLERFPLEVQDWAKQLSALEKELHPGTSRVITDTPDADKVTHYLPEEVAQLWSSAKTEVLVTNAYLIPDEISFSRTQTNLQKDVRFVMLTNSLASTDAAGVHAHYTQWRPRMVAGGVELYELKQDAAMRSQVADTHPVKSGFVGLHAKAMVIDRKRVLIGSMNLDPRSWVHNSEMVILVECPELGAELAQVIERDLKPENAWKIELDAQGAVRWVAGTETRHEAPAREEGQRFEESLNLLLPADLF
ncbi:MAG: phospholipase D family protein [Archangium sp.]|nr:phospholipase D family protein [Archangium sp.]